MENMVAAKSFVFLFIFLHSNLKVLCDEVDGNNETMSLETYLITMKEELEDKMESLVKSQVEKVNKKLDFLSKELKEQIDRFEKMEQAFKNLTESDG